MIIHINNTAYASIWRENALYTLFDFKREFICGLSKKHTGFNLSKTTLQFCILCLLIVHFLCLLVIIYKNRTSSLLSLHKRDEIKNNVNDNIHLYIWLSIIIFIVLYQTERTITKIYSNDTHYIGSNVYTSIVYVRVNVYCFRIWLLYIILVFVCWLNVYQISTH